MMDTGERPSAEYRFADPVDMLTTLDILGIEYLEVSNERTIIIYNNTILDCEVAERQLHDARTVIVDVFDLGPHVNAATDADPVALIESLIEEIATTAAVDWDHH